MYPGLGRAVGGMLGVGAQTLDRAAIDDAATATLAHLRHLQGAPGGRRGGDGAQRRHQRGRDRRGLRAELLLPGNGSGDHRVPTFAELDREAI